MDNELRKKLISMTDAESKARQTLTDGRRYDGYPDELEELHIQRATEPLQIINEYGWPGKSLVEKDGAMTVFSLARNAISKPELQKQFLKHLEEAVLTGEATAIQKACLQDNILFYQDNPQQYGMFFDGDESGELVVHVENISQTNERRKALGLKPWRRLGCCIKRKLNKKGVRQKISKSINVKNLHGQRESGGAMPNIRARGGDNAPVS